MQSASRPHVSQSQKTHMLRYLQKNPRLAYRKFSASFSVNDAREGWKYLSKSLNSLPGKGSVKTWKQWRKTWQDLKSKTKMKFLQGNDTLTREEKIIFKISGGFSDDYDNTLPGNADLEAGTDESRIDSDELITPSEPNHYIYELFDGKYTDKGIIIEIEGFDKDTQDKDSDSRLSNQDGNDAANPDKKISQNEEAEEKYNGRSDATDDMTANKRCDKKDPELTASYRDKKMLYLRRTARASERSAMANERIADALERIVCNLKRVK